MVIGFLAWAGHTPPRSILSFLFLVSNTLKPDVTKVLLQATPRSPDVSSRHAAAANGASHPTTDAADAGQRVFLQSTRHVARAWATYGALLPIFKTTADVPVNISRAVQSLFEEFMLWTVVTFAGVTPATVVRGVNGKDDRFFRVVWSLMLRSDRASRTRRYGSQLQAAVQSADKVDGTGGDGGKGTALGSLRSMELQEGVGMGGGTLDRLVRGTIACDALATLAQDLLELEPVLVRPRLENVPIMCSCRAGGSHRVLALSVAAQPGKIVPTRWTERRHRQRPQLTATLAGPAAHRWRTCARSDGVTAECVFARGSTGISRPCIASLLLVHAGPW